MDCCTTWLGPKTFPTEPVGLAYVQYCLVCGRRVLWDLGEGQRRPSDLNRRQSTHRTGSLNEQRPVFVRETVKIPSLKVHQGL